MARHPGYFDIVVFWIQVKWRNRFNLLGLAALNTTVAYGLTQLISTAASVKTDYIPTPGRDIGVCAGILASWAILNITGRRTIRYILYTSLLINTFGVLSFVIAILAKAPTYQPASFVFRSFIDDSSIDGSEGWAVRASPAYVALIGSMMGLSNFAGYDASAHIAEETRRASLIAPVGIVTSVGLSALCGFVLILALLFSIQDFELLVSSPYNQPVLASLIDIFGKNGALILFTLPMICCWYCGLFLTMSNSRVTWAFSRDRGIVSLSLEYGKTTAHHNIALLFQQSR
jgi:amino acid transporter